MVDLTDLAASLPAKHTPGPWEYDGGAQIVEAGRPHMRICFLPSDHHKYASSEANARLIAAAPDVYSALMALVIACEAPTRPLDFGVRVKAARAALAKAEGRS